MFLSIVHSSLYTKWLMDSIAQLCAMDKQVLERRSPWPGRLPTTSIEDLCRGASIRSSQRLAAVSTMPYPSRSRLSKSITSSCLTCSLQCLPMSSQEVPLRFKMHQMVKPLSRDWLWYTARTKKRRLTVCSRVNRIVPLETTAWTWHPQEAMQFSRSMWKADQQSSNQKRLSPPSSTSSTLQETSEPRKRTQRVWQWKRLLTSIGLFHFWNRSSSVPAIKSGTMCLIDKANWPIYSRTRSVETAGPFWLPTFGPRQTTSKKRFRHSDLVLAWSKSKTCLTLMKCLTSLCL